MMSGQDPLVVIRRSLSVEDYIDIAMRHKAWILGPTFAALVVAVVTAFMWPDTYYSTAAIRVVPSGVPETYFPPNIITDMQSQINNLTQGILNRANLTSLVNKYQLYKKDLTRLPMEDVIENMKRHDITIGSVQTFGQSTQGKQAVPAFQIGFKNTNRFTAQKVTEDIASSFIVESTNEITRKITSTTELLQTQWETAKTRLNQCDSSLQAFREAHPGRLGDQNPGNSSEGSSLKSQLFSIDDQMSRVQQEKLQLDNEMRIAKMQFSQLKDPNADPQAVELRDERLAQKDKEIDAVENSIARLRERYRDTHPDVQQAVQQLNLIKKQREEIKTGNSSRPKFEARQLPPNAQYVKEQQSLQITMQRIASMQEAKELQLEDLQKRSRRTTEELKQFESRSEATPLLEREYTELLSDRDLALKNYQDADVKLTQSMKALDVVKHQQGERLEILDPASTPQTPTEPKRVVIIAVGTGIGLALGLLLAGLREVRDTSLKNLKDVRAYAQLPVLGSIPLLENDLVVRRRRRLGWLAWSTACLVGVVIMSSSVAYYFSSKV